MRPLRLVMVSLLVAACLVSAATALAGRRQSPPEPFSSAALSHALQQAPLAAPGICQLGINGTPSPSGPDNVIYFDGSDNYLTLIKADRATCATCTTFTQAVVEAAHLALYIKAAPCTIGVRVRVVQAAVAPLCVFPERFNAVCDAYYVTLIAPVPEKLEYFSIPFLPAVKCSIAAGVPHFLEFNFQSINPACSSQVAKPRIMPRDAGVQCLSYNAWEEEQHGFDYVLTFLSGNPIMYADILLCESTPTRRRTWGQLKLLYR